MFLEMLSSLCFSAEVGCDCSTDYNLRVKNSDEHPKAVCASFSVHEEAFCLQQML